MVESRLLKELVQVCVISSCSFNLAKTPKKSPVFIVSPLHRSMTRLVIIMTTRARLNTLFITGHRENSPPALLEPRFLRLHAQIQRLIGVMHGERDQYDEATKSHMKMNQ